MALSRQRHLQPLSPTSGPDVLVLWHPGGGGDTGTCHPGVQGGFRTSQERQKPLPQARGRYTSPKPPLCASVGIKTSKGMAHSGGMVTGGVGNGEWGSTHQRRGTREPLAQPRHSPVSGDRRNREAQPKVTPYPGGAGDRSGLGVGMLLPANTREPVGTRQVPGDAGISPRCYSPQRRASSGAFYSSPWLCRTAKPRKPRCAVPGTPITPGTGTGGAPHWLSPLL